ncbi:MFS transporter [Luteimonas terricola]|uniref:MFS transporter n=1 Tax=Luteimonas terricola TaxID=645597 RepID=A0ABQ2ED38_9GAMM|nr:MFS transporter [Luteimonas terricola]GGK06253.1 MFS transporter [Luteimonas terricola]
MLEILRERTFRRLFGAQVVALVGTGLATVALALLAYDLAGAQAGSVLGTALAIKMVVYVTLAPLAGATVPPRLRKAVLIGLDLVRAAAALMLPFVTEIWQVYVLIALLQSASACFTPLFQSLIPEILPEERDYTRALSLSRLAYDLESLLSPAIAAALLTMISFHGLFAGTSAGFIASALLVMATTFPVVHAARAAGSPYARALRGMRIYLHTPRLRGLLALNLCAAAGGAMVFVNTVVIVRGPLQGGEREVAWALAAFGAGSMAVALLLPKLLERIQDRSVMLGAASVMVGALFAATGLWAATQGRLGWALLIPLWCVLGAAYAGLVTPGGRLLRRSAQADDLPFLFAAQFSLSHVCWLLAYPLAGWVGAAIGLGSALVALSCVAVLGLFVAWRAWPCHDPDVVEHSHPELSDDHPHLVDHQVLEGKHMHPYRIDELHGRWPQ